MSTRTEVKFGQHLLIAITTLEREGKTPDHTVEIPGELSIATTHLGPGAGGTAITLHYGHHLYTQLLRPASGRWKFRSGTVKSCNPSGKVIYACDDVSGAVTEGNLALDKYLTFLQEGGKPGLA